jgi:cytochrome P450
VVNPAAYDPYSWSVQDDPYPVYRWLRDHAPVYRCEERDCVALSRYADVVSALRDPRFSNRNGVSLDLSTWGPQARRTSSFLAMDAPDHTAIRGLVASAFCPRRVSALEPRIRQLVRSRLSPLLDQDSFDFARDFAAPLPLEVICELTGVPPGDRGQVRQAADLLTPREDGAGDRDEAGAGAVRLLYRYYLDLAAGLRRHPGSDLTSALTQAHGGGLRLDDDQIAGILFLLITAGNDSTGKLLGNAWYQGWLHPDVRRAGLDGRAADWAAETLRYDSSSQMMARTLTSDTVMHGVRIPGGARVVLLPASANRDERVFGDPDRFDLDRRDAGQAISFGYGPHYCLGAPLARLQARIALEELGTVIAGYELDPEGIVRGHWPHIRGFTALPCRVTRRPAPRRRAA